MNLLVSTLACLLLLNGIMYLGKKIRVPGVVCMIVGSVIIGSTDMRSFFVGPHEEFYAVIGNIGLLCMMFVAGLESNGRILKKERHDALIISVMAGIFPFVLGFLLFFMLDFGFLQSLIAGVCLSISAEATNARILLEAKMFNTKVGAAILEAGLIDEVFGLIFFLVVMYAANVVSFGEDLLVAGAILALFVGMWIKNHVLRLKAGEHHRHLPIGKFESILFHTLVPFFFISMGLAANAYVLHVNRLLVLLTITVAIAGKLLGTFAASHFVRFNWSQLWIIGWGLNSRGAVELTILLIALRAGLMPVELYTALLTMTIVSTIIFPYALMWQVGKHPIIMG